MSKDHDNEWQTEKRGQAANNATAKSIKVKKQRLATGKRKAKVAVEKIDLGKWPMILAGVAAAAVLLGIIVFYKSTVSHTNKADAAPIDASEEEWQGLLPRQVAQRFNDATTYEERLKWVRDPEDNALLVENFYNNGAGAKEKILELKQMDTVGTDKFIIHRFQARLDGGTSRLLSVVQMGNRAYVDFKAYARHCSSRWEDLLSGAAPAAAEVRVFLDLGTAYMNQYADEEKWTSYTATTPDWEMPLYFYAARGSRTDEALRALTSRGTQRATLSIRANDGSHEKKQFEIVELLAAGWCY
jgi:hypothetical protein